ncbi:MAG TPA: thioredoxin domain-containing protein [Bryobacteraceae bacterium]|nr:thioredoxin domain-containing protein [Bryobacteraceae bacterium]
MKLLAVALALALPCLAQFPEPDKGKALGNPSAPITIEVFSDFTCPHCRHFHDEELPALMRDYVVKGKVYLVFRDFPLTGPGHEYSRQAATYATAAARIGKYEAVADALFANQGTWALNGQVWPCVASVLSPADQKRVQALSKDPGVVAEVERELQEGLSTGVNSTPTLVVNRGGKRFPMPSTVDYSLLRSFLDAPK